MQSPYPTPAPLKVFNVPELRDNVFQLLDKPSLTVCARVCLSWSGHALELNWKKLESIIPLLSILCPLKTNDQDEWFFTRDLEVNDWDRFQLYCDKIRSLTIQEDETLFYSCDDMRLKEKKISACLTPSLTELIVFCPKMVTFSCHFIHCGLREIELHLPQNSVAIETVMADLSRKTRGLEKISFYINPADPWTRLIWTRNAFDEGLDCLLRSDLKSLRVLQLPYMTTSTMQALTGLESLTEINRTAYLNCASALNADYYWVNPRMPSLRLTHLDTMSCFWNVSILLRHLPNLQSLNVYACRVETSTSLEFLVAVASYACLSLKALHIIGIPEGWNYRKATATAKQRSTCDVSMTTIHALKRMSRLEAFLIAWPYPLNITEDGLSRLLPHLTNLSTLFLNPSPIVLDKYVDYTLPLNILPKITERCPKIRQLGLFLDCTNVPSQGTDKSRSLSNLTFLNLGHSSVGGSSIQLAQWLAYQGCSDACLLEEARYAWMTDLFEPLMIDHYGPDYAEGLWDGEVLVIEKKFQEYKESQGEENSAPQYDG